MMKTCTQCHIEKDDEKFYFRTGKHEKRVSKCSTCLNTYRLQKAKEARERAGKKAGFTTLSQDTVDKIKEMIADKKPLSNISLEIGVSYGRIHSYRRAGLL
jgi:hypothetical protein